MKILHCIYDDKFMDGTIRVYNSDDRHENTYAYVFSKENDKNLEYTKYRDILHICETEFLKLASVYDVIILHSLKCMSLKVIASIPLKCKVIWYGWGFDLYNGADPAVKLNLLYDRTKKIIKRTQTRNRLKDLLYQPFRLRDRYQLKKALIRVDYFSGVFPFEYELLKNARPYLHAKKLDFYYGDTNFFIDESVNNIVETDHKNFILGNSGDPSNNHCDALDYLKNIELPQEARFIIPMNYGGNTCYRKYVAEYANNIFHDNTYVLDSFLPLNEYLKLVSKCQVAIFFHERQQASDNILMQLQYGAKVYLSETCLTYTYLKDKGYKVYSLQRDIDEIMTPLSKEDVIHNRSLLVKQYSAYRIVDRVKVINDILLDDIAH